MARIYLTALSLLLSMVLPSTSVAAGSCFKSPEQAILYADRVADAHMEAGSTGYRVESRRIDPVLGGVWATVVSCEHPEWPPVMLEAEAGEKAGVTRAIATVRAAPVVRLGRRVKVMVLADRLRLEMTAVAQADGSVGESVRVRILRLSPEAPEQFMNAIVIAPDYLEIRE